MHQVPRRPEKHASPVAPQAMVGDEHGWFQALVSNGFDAISVLDADGYITYIQPIPGGRPHDELIGRHHNTWIHPDDVGSVEDAIAELLTKGGGATAEVTCRADFGEGFRWVEQRFTNLLEDAAIAGIVSNLRDVTERVEAEDERRKQQEWFEALVSNSFDAASVLDAEGIITYLQPLADGYRSEQMLGRRQREFIHPDDVELWDETFAHLIQRGTGASAEVTFRADFPDGYRWFETRLRNLLEDATIAGIAVNGRDVTGRRNAELRLEHQATHDVLTGLSNRAVLLDRVDHALGRTARHGGLVAVLFLDLDGFKAVNDT
ncbi:MAG: PAS domain S-box protein, partial [Acidimicrobiales bacterium]